MFLLPARMGSSGLRTLKWECYFAKICAAGGDHDDIDAANVKELSKITMPVVFNEPLSFLQRMVEYMEYADLLRQASRCDDPLRRHEVNFHCSYLLQINK